MNKALLPYLASSDYRIYGNTEAGMPSPEETRMLVEMAQDPAIIARLADHCIYDNSYFATAGGRVGILVVLEFLTIESDGEACYTLWSEALKPSQKNVLQYVARKYAPLQSQYRQALFFVSQGDHTPQARVTVNAFMPIDAMTGEQMDAVVESLMYGY